MSVSKAVKTLGLFRRFNQLEKGFGANLPAAYKKFYKEWQLTEPTAVHYVPEKGKWRYDEATNQVFPIQNIPLKLKYPLEYDDQLWGGEAVIQGFEKKEKYNRRNPHFWVPTLHRSVVYSEVLNKHISVVVTKRALNLIHSNYGFDHYLLKTPACDLKSLLAVGLKRNILQELQNGCESSKEEPAKQKEVLERYGQYLAAYTSEEIEWYGYSFKDACSKLSKMLEANNRIVPLKEIYRAELIDKLKAAKIAELEKLEQLELSGTSTWLNKINPFAKKPET